MVYFSLQVNSYCNDCVFGIIVTLNSEPVANQPQTKTELPLCFTDACRHDDLNQKLQVWINDHKRSVNPHFQSCSCVIWPFSLFPFLNCGFLTASLSFTKEELERTSENRRIIARHHLWGESCSLETQVFFTVFYVTSDRLK